MLLAESSLGMGGVPSFQSLSLPCPAEAAFFEEFHSSSYGYREKPHGRCRSESFVHSAPTDAYDDIV